MSAVDGDLLSATSLITAVVGLLYGTWYGEIKDAAGRESAPGEMDAEQLDVVRSAFRAKAAPLAVVSSLMCVVLAAPAVKVIGHAVMHTDQRYDPVQACFVVVVALLVFLAITTVKAAWDVRKTAKRLAS